MYQDSTQFFGGSRTQNNVNKSLNKNYSLYTTT
jgi:hypothetical protein